MKRLNLPPRTNPLVAIAEVDNPVIVVTTVAIIITTTDRPLGKKKRDENTFIYFNLPYLQLVSIQNLHYI